MIIAYLSIGGGLSILPGALPPFHNTEILFQKQGSKKPDGQFPAIRFIKCDLSSRILH